MASSQNRLEIKFNAVNGGNVNINFPRGAAGSFAMPESRTIELSGDAGAALPINSVSMTQYEMNFNVSADGSTYTAVVFVDCDTSTDIQCSITDGQVELNTGFSTGSRTIVPGSGTVTISWG